MNESDALNAPPVDDPDEEKGTGEEQALMPATEDPPVTPQGASDNPVPPPATEKAKGKSKSSSKESPRSEAAGKTKVDDSMQNFIVGFSPTLAGLKLIQRGVKKRFEELDSGQIRVQGNNGKWIEFFASMYRNNEPVPKGVAIRIEGTEREKLVDGHKRCLGRKVAGFEDFEVDIYEGTEQDALNVALELNRGGDRLKPEDVVKAAVMAQGLGIHPNISELARKAGISRPTARKLYRQEMSKTGSVLDGFKEMKKPKTKREIAEGLADKVMEALEEGNGEVIQLIFEKMPADIRQHHLHALSERFDDKAGA